MKNSGFFVLVSVETSSLVVQLSVRFGRGLGFRLSASRIWESLKERSSEMPNDNGSPSSANGHYYCKNSNSSSIRQSIFEKLDENPSLTAKNLCKLLDLPYSKYWNYVGGLRHEWKYYHRNEHGSKCSIHAWRGWCYVPDGLDRLRAVNEGWLTSKARNRWLLWRDELGRLQWFETGRVNLYVRKPASLGRARAHCYTCQTATTIVSFKSGPRCSCSMLASIYS
jgi:hypothetical protein